MTDSRFDNNVIYRLVSANRAGTLPASSKLNTSPKNPKMYFSLGGTASAPTFTMKPMPPLNGPINKLVDPGMNWFFRYPAVENPPENYWTMHNAITGEKVCLERGDTETGTLKMAPLAKGKPSQMWYIELAEGMGSENIWKIQDRPAKKEAMMGAPKPTKLDVLDRGDGVVARTIVGNPIDPKTNRPYVESTAWDVQSVRGMEDKENVGVGFPS
jgi:hypothetical protein